MACTRTVRFASLACLASFLVTTTVHGGRQVFTIKEHLNRQWTGEFVSYPVEFKAGQCVPESVQLTGPDGPVPVQLFDVELSGDGKHVLKARVAFVVTSLGPRTSREYVLTYGLVPPPGPALPSDLNVSAEGDIIELSTSRFAVRIPAGDAKPDTPLDADAAPGPFTSLRLDKDKWFGGSGLYGPAKVTAWRTEILDRGPVLARTRTTYRYEDGNELTITAHLVAGDYAMRAETHVEKTRDDCGWTFDLNRGVTVQDALLLPGIGKYVKKENKRAITPNADEPLCYLCSWPGDGWFQDSPSALRLRFAERQDELQMCVVDAGSWVEPDPRPEWADFQPWDYEQIPEMWSGWQSKRIPLFVSNDGTVTLRSDLLQGWRKWMLGVNRQGNDMLDRYVGKTMSVYTALPRLDEVKEMVLEWPSKQRHPSLMMDAREMRRVAEYKQKAFAKATDVGVLREYLTTLGCIDLMRSPKPIAYLYDGVMGFAELEEEERALLKAQMAYLGYLVKSPLHWSFERGCNSGNPNMTVSRTVNVGLIGCVLKDHPMGPVWAQYAMDWITYWLDNVTDEKGEWIESSHYARYAYSCMILFAIAARQTGIGDLFTHPKFREMGIFYEKTLTPPDLLRPVANAQLGPLPSYGIRVDPPYGRGTRGDAWELGGLLARATAKTDPEYSRMMQWSWRQCGFVEWLTRKTSGQTELYLNRNLPGRVPDWHSEFFPNLGYLLRSRVGTDREDYLLFVSQYYRSADGEKWPSHTGTITKWFAGGVPMGGAFIRLYGHSNVILENRVMLACNWDPEQGVPPESGYVTRTTHEAFAPLAALDYVNVRFEVPEIKKHILKINPKVPAFPVRDDVGEPPLVWQRQVMWLKPTEPDDPGCLVMRDSVLCGEPTQWHFWTLSDGIATPGQVVDREAYLNDRPGHELLPARQIDGDRFVAVGQFGMDLDYYIASPTDTPRYTARHGGKQSGYGLRGYPEYQDLMHLQLPGRGDYFVGMVPRRAGRRMPLFRTIGDGVGIHVASDFGQDYCFLTRDAVDVRDGDVSFQGTAGCVKDRHKGLTLALAAAGKLRCRDHGLEARHAMTVQAHPYSLIVDTGLADFPGGTATVTAPGKWRLADTPAGVVMKQRRRTVELTIPAGCRSVVLVAD